MERAVTILLFAIAVAPILALFVLVALAHLAPAAPMLARASFICPHVRRRVNAAFLTSPSSRRPVDVVSCSAFPDPEHVRCEKGCLDLAETRWQPSPVTPRYSLIADGVASWEDEQAHEAV